MSNNYWQAPNNQNGHATPENPPRKSGLLSNYAGQQAVPSNRPAPQGPPTQSAPSQNSQPTLYKGQPSQQQLPPPQPQWNGPTFMARPIQMVQRLSAKMVAMRRPAQPPVDPNPLVRYHDQQMPTPPNSKPVPTRATPWRRSRVRRITH
ncbi:MAG: hypothetical protein ACRDHZ_05325, partial [Ktedonobacteraceae bacterium]